MNCHEVSQLSHAAADGELDARSSAELESHLRACPNCARELAGAQAIKSAVGQNATYFAAPEGLETKLKTSLGLPRQRIRTEPRWSFIWPAWKWPLSLAGTAAATALITVVVMGGPGESRLAGELAGDHVRSLMPGHLMDVASTDQHTVKPWFNGRLDFSPPVVDLAEKGFPLTGGRLEYVQGHHAAALVYQRAKHVINLFIWPDARTADEEAFARNGFNLVTWRAGGMSFWAVSDLNPRELNEFVSLYRSQSGASTP